MIITAYRQLTKQEASGGPGFIPAVADCRYRAPLSPRLVRPCPTPQAASGRLLVYIIQHFPSRIKRLTIKFLYSFSQKGFTFFKVLLYYKINWKEWQSCTFSPIPLRARGSAGRAFGSHPRGRGFKSLRVHHSAKIRTLHCSQCLRVNHQDRGSLKDGPLSSFRKKDAPGATNIEKEWTQMEDTSIEAISADPGKPKKQLPKNLL